MSILTPGLPFLVVVTGGRAFNDEPRVRAPLDAIRAKYPNLLLYVGDCPGGVDRLAWAWAMERNIPRRRFVAQWRRYGLAAGPKRNRSMISAAVETPARGRAVAVFPGGRGTADCAGVAYLAGLPVWNVYPGWERPYLPNKGGR